MIPKVLDAEPRAIQNGEIAAMLQSISIQRVGTA
jgi:hypothetical protein